MNDAMMILRDSGTGITIPITKISFSSSSGTIPDESTKKPKLNITPSNATESVKFTSSNTSIATVDANGTIKGKKVGTATITAKTPSGLTAKYKVTVRKIRILMLGNSKTYYYNMPYYLSQIAKSGGYSVDITWFGSANGGFRLVNNFPDLKQYYDKSSVSSAVKNVVEISKFDQKPKIYYDDPDTDEKDYKNVERPYIIGKAYDYVIMQEATIALGTNSSRYDVYKQGVGQVVNAVTKGNKNVKIYIRKTWRYNKPEYTSGGTTYKAVSGYNATRNILTDKVKLLDTKETINFSDYNIGLINDGPAMYWTDKNYSEAKVFNSYFYSDIRHQSTTGSYLTAYCIYAKVFNTDPRKNSYDGIIDTTSTYDNALHIENGHGIAFSPADYSLENRNKFIKGKEDKLKTIAYYKCYGDHDNDDAIDDVIPLN